MNRGILILDEMPDCCPECDFLGSDNLCDPYYLNLTDSDIGKRPDWCPIHEMPHHLTVVEAAKKGNVAGCVSEMDAWRKGWNDCLKEIMGDDEDE